jgi:F-type H+-transporting ATPase subunit b
VVSIDYTLVLQIVNFLTLIFILNVLLYKPILGIIEKRQKQLDDSQDEIKRLNLSVEERMAQYEEKVRQAKLAALDQKNQALAEGSDVAKSTIDAVRGEIPKMIEQFHGKLAKEVEDARGILSSQSQKISREIAEKVLGRSVQ